MGMTFLTLGYYLVYWLFTRRKALNQLHSNRKVYMAIPVLFLVVSLLWDGSDFIVWVMEGLGKEPLFLRDFSDLMRLLWWIQYLVIVFYLRRLLLDHFKAIEQPFHISRVLTFFFGEWHLQGCLNNYHDYIKEKKNDAESLSGS
ncbi:DUF4234 domain-containing protein [Melghirimyces profundicolus]|nr:DUF4234 domain-containing protein [Melghirimyces profundicolus]